ncbi:MBOAT family O-acyltransferase [Salegentibacter agarivorans]|uniref:MBOAT family O-acyltransferase n=1 Tax=Salegentibacter agarivorans TaxID=345907 RepID=UPI0029373F13|nr:MBOAT family O-acyltransferase [Salegentibacter agarivorans]
MLLILSYIFYGWWDWRFLSLIAFSSFVDYHAGIYIYRAKRDQIKKLWLWLSILVNLGFLGVFKYYNFFAESFAGLFLNFGYEVDALTLDIILPVGISFYTFQTMSYTIDIYRRRLVPTTNMLHFFTFVSFFPQLVAGPIERATNLLPQFHKKRFFDYAFAAEGLRQILWGLFKKVVIADNSAIIVNQVFENYHELGPVDLIVGAVFFTFQIYGDFSGYSDIAIGTAKLFGFKLMQNFAFPYFSRDISEFWRRWHISLSTWFRDYLYIPLGGSKGGKWMTLRNIFIIFIVSGLWHGANWTFVVWGGLNALYMVPLIIFNLNRYHTSDISKHQLLPNISQLFNIILTFVLTCLAFIFFRSLSIKDAWEYLSGIFIIEGWAYPTVDIRILVFVFFMLIVEWFNRDRSFGLSISNLPIIARWLIYISILMILILFGKSSDSFIYFQF